MIENEKEQIASYTPKKKFSLMRKFKKIKKFFSSNTSESKEDCFEEILNSTLQLKVHLSDAVFRLPYTNAIYLNYSLFKQFAKPSNFDTMTLHFALLIEDVLKDFSTFQIHVNLKTFTVSAIDKYKNLIYSFYKKGYYDAYINYIEAICIYHTPSIFETLKNVFVTIFNMKEYTMEPVLYSKKESDVLLEKLLYRIKKIDYSDEPEERSDEVQMSSKTYI